MPATPLHMDPSPTQRLDQWLFHARFFKSRTLAGKMCNGKKIRKNGDVQSKASAMVQSGDVLTFAKGEKIYVIKIVAFAKNRGPAPFAQTLYEDLSPKEESRASKALGAQSILREKGAGRPTKKERRATDRLREFPE